MSWVDCNACQWTVIGTAKQSQRCRCHLKVIFWKHCNACQSVMSCLRIIRSWGELQQCWFLGMTDSNPTAAAAAKSLQSCPTLCNPIDGSPPGSPIPGILQVRRLEWVAISFSNAWKWKVKVKSLSRVRLLATPWTAAYQASLSMGFSRQEYWSGLPLSSPSILLNQYIWFKNVNICPMTYPVTNKPFFKN